MPNQHEDKTFANIGPRRRDRINWRDVWSVSGEILDTLISQSGLPLSYHAEHIGCSVSSLKNWRAGDTVSTEYLYSLAEYFGPPWSDAISALTGWHLVRCPGKIVSLDERREWRQRVHALSQQHDEAWREAVG
jgi:hypothetical protein